MNKRMKWAYLLQNSSFLDGMPRSIDLFGSFDKYEKREPDIEAFIADWALVMGDLEAAYQKVREDFEQREA